MRKRRRRRSQPVDRPSSSDQTLRGSMSQPPTAPKPLTESPQHPLSSPASSRRSFIKGGGIMLAGSAMAPGLPDTVHAGGQIGDAKLRIGLVGCGWRGTATVDQWLGSSNGPIELTAAADVFPHAIQSSYRSLKGKHGHRVNLGNRRFTGWDGFEKLLGTDVDLVIVATPPAFRPEQFDQAIGAGKHVLLEKPLAVDAPGVRQILRTHQVAMQKNQFVAAGFQRRYDERYRQCIARIQDGVIGDLLGASTQSQSPRCVLRPVGSGEDPMEYQLRHWQAFVGLGGGAMIESHVQNLDVINWLLDEHPVEAAAARPGQDPHGLDRPVPAGASDVCAVEFRYPCGLKLRSSAYVQPPSSASHSRQSSEIVWGTRGIGDLSRGVIRDLKGNVLWQSTGSSAKGHSDRLLRDDAIEGLRKGAPARDRLTPAAESTLTAILGSMAAASDASTTTWGQVWHSPAAGPRFVL